jgi:hypothetical protein
MKLATLVASGALLATLGTAAFAADQSITGTVQVLDRINNEIGIKPEPAGQTTGANAAGAVQKFRMRGALPDTLHAEDKVTVTYSEDNGVKTITNVTLQ